MILKEEDLLRVSGGGVFNTGLFVGIGSVIAFLISVADGFLNPTKCNV